MLEPKRSHILLELVALLAFWGFGLLAVKWGHLLNEPGTHWYRRGQVAGWPVLLLTSYMIPMVARLLFVRWIVEVDRSSLRTRASQWRSNTIPATRIVGVRPVRLGRFGFTLVDREHAGPVWIFDRFVDWDRERSLSAVLSAALTVDSEYEAVLRRT